MSNIIPMNYDDRSFPFASDCWFNATVAAKRHGRKVTEWLRLPSTKEYMSELCQELGIWRRFTGLCVPERETSSVREWWKYSPTP